MRNSGLKGLMETEDTFRRGTSVFIDFVSSDKGSALNGRNMLPDPTTHLFRSYLTL